MRSIDKLERERLAEQSRLDAQKTPAERNAWGQFATPPALARQIAELAKQLWVASDGKVRFLEPALGTGAFYAAMRQAFPKNAVDRAVGVELDRDFAVVARRLWQKTGLHVIQTDFTKLSPSDIKVAANLILTNPPYVRHHHIGSQEKERLQGAVAKALGYETSGLSGLYSYFLLLSHEWLAENGLALWLIPSEFMDVNYGSALRKYLTERVTLLQVHRFDPEDLQFEDALVTSVVVVFRKAPPLEGHEVRFSTGKSLVHPSSHWMIPLQKLHGGARWNGTATFSRAAILSDQIGPRVSDFFTVKRGIATGATEFFVLPRQRAEELGIPSKFLKPILPSPRHLRDSVVQADAGGYPVLEEQLVLIDCDLPETEVRRNYPAFWQYLMGAQSQRIRERYLVQQREPWYHQEQRPPAPFLCTYMGRGRNGGKPFRFVWNQSQATAPNLYLMLYPKGLLAEALSNRPELAETVYDWLQSIDVVDLLDHGRVYGGGLHKLEPKELGRVPARSLLDRIGRKRELLIQGSLLGDRIQD